jgi:hypothetical protein
MADRIVEHVHTDGGGGGAMTVLAVVVLIALLFVVLYFTGVFGRMFGSRDTKIDVNINKPGVVLYLH